MGSRPSTSCDRTRAVARQERSSRALLVASGTQLLGTFIFLLVAISVWFDQPARFAASVGLITAGLAIALQRVITAVAAYFVILRGNVFNVGDRIAMAGVRGDVIALGYTRTTIMEMGSLPPCRAMTRQCGSRPASTAAGS